MASPLETIESLVAREPLFGQAAQQQRREALGFHEADVASFVQQCEFISLGSYCGVAEALQALGLRRTVYPFDWVRAPLSGVIDCFKSGFRDFFHFTSRRLNGGQPVCERTAWGGSFWHHDPELPETVAAFSQRIGYLLSPTESTRLFVYVLNSSTELLQVANLVDALEGCYAQSGPVRLLIVVEGQQSEALLSVQGLGSSRVETLCYSVVGDSIWSADKGLKNIIEKRCEAYGRAIMSAVKWWAGGRHERRDELQHVPQVPDVHTLLSAIDPYDAGCCATERFWPRKMPDSCHLGRRVASGRPDATIRACDDDGPKPSKPLSMQGGSTLSMSTCTSSATPAAAAAGAELNLPADVGSADTFSFEVCDGAALSSSLGPDADAVVLSEEARSKSFKWMAATSGYLQEVAGIRSVKTYQDELEEKTLTASPVQARYRRLSESLATLTPGHGLDESSTLTVAPGSLPVASPADFRCYKDEPAYYAELSWGPWDALVGSDNSTAADLFSEPLERYRGEASYFAGFKDQNFAAAVQEKAVAVSGSGARKVTIPSGTGPAQLESSAAVASKSSAAADSKQPTLLRGLHESQRINTVTKDNAAFVAEKSAENSPSNRQTPRRNKKVTKPASSNSAPFS
eukprot:TRINITY_DN81385_c0_g1_i1.p1 TRINITY_DN81385_c0_g1~~TRINITY_DN81385_c0_g1_i1.p1  ORF type:complete len:631 (-),score=117.38 TRINITY_DN81385_c0_g1_i1:88-1980(-)